VSVQRRNVYPVEWVQWQDEGVAVPGAESMREGHSSWSSQGDCTLTERSHTDAKDLRRSVGTVHYELYAK